MCLNDGRNLCLLDCVRFARGSRPGIVEARGAGKEGGDRSDIRGVLFVSHDFLLWRALRTVVECNAVRHSQFLVLGEPLCRPPQNASIY